MLRLGNAASSGKPGRRRKVKTQPQLTVTLPRSQSQPRRKPKKSRRRMVSDNRAPWWLLAEFSVTSTTPAGPLETIVLHPTLFPDTPYQTQCAHHTHRRERMWELDIRVTTASTTGLRAAVLFLADPRMISTALPSSLIWSAVMNKQGTLATSTGTGQTRTRFHVPTTTPLLSNAAPDSSLGLNLTGFAAGVVGVYLLDPPIGLSGNSKVSITVLARVSMDQHGPVTGFLGWSSKPQPGPGPGPKPPPGPVAGFSVTIRGNFPMPLNDHTASAWLAGGYYWRIDKQGAGWAGEIWTHAIYQITQHPPYNWQDNDQKNKYPKFLVTWVEPASSVCQVVGFELYQDAYNQAAGHTGSVPHGAECCITYNQAAPTYGDRFEGMIPTEDNVLQFQLLKKTDQSTIWRQDGSVGRTYDLLPDHPARFPGIGPGQTGMTGALSVNPPATSLIGLTNEIQTLRSTVSGLQTLCHDLMSNLPTSTPPSSPFRPIPTKAPRSWLQSLASLNPFTSFSNNLQPTSSQPSTPLPPPQPTSTQSCPASLAASPANLPFFSTNLADWPTPSAPSPAYSLPANVPTQLPIGYEQLPPTWELLECPGCDDPNCDDCFEDDPQGLPSSGSEV